MRIASPLALALAFCLLPAAVHAQAPADSAMAGKLRLFLDCSTYVCDFDFLKQQMTYVDWVRDRHDADLHVLVTTRTTGSGGDEVLFYVTRLRGGGPASDTVRVYSPPAASDDDGRRLLLRALQSVVARDLVGRPEFDRMKLVVDAPSAGAAAAAPAVKRDPWNAWVFRVSANGWFNGEKSQNFINAYGNVSASRVTEAAKLSISSYGSYYGSNFTFEDGSEFRSLQRSAGGSVRAVKTLARRWSAGGRAFTSTSTFSNVKLEWGAGPAIEYNVWPYAESSRRLLTFGYEVTARRERYEEITLYGRTFETLFKHGLTSKIDLKQPWGSVGIGVDLSQYLHDASKYRGSISGDVQLQVLHGFSLNLNGYAARIHDQLSLRRGNATDSQVIARQHQLATAYEYYTSVGISYTFGSIFNSVVNPRMAEMYGSF